MSLHRVLLGMVTLVVAAGMCLPVTAAAGDKNLISEVTKLLKADVSEEVILAYIAKEGVAEDLGADDIVALKEAGASQFVLIALMGGKPGEQPRGGYPFDLDDAHEVGEPIRHGVMAVYPIVRKAPASVGTYLTLDEAVTQKVIVIEEKGSGSVPVVIIKNVGKLPIYISAGEIIIGGKQDRIVAYDVIIRPLREISVDVRCVEQGRWHGARKEFSSAGAMGGRSTKMAAQFSSQSAVWSAVADQNAQVEAETSTGTYRAALEKPEVLRTHSEYAATILPRLEGRNVVGMVVAINGKVHAIEIFGSPALFDRLKGKLLKAYVMDTVGLEVTKAGLPTQDEIVSFYKTTMEAEETRLKEYESNRNLKRESPAAAASESLDADGVMLHRSLLAQ